jgi:Heterokaryon incompatibility protein (HET)
VDAICINRKDLNERSSQVDLMREIYSKAELVLSWLGHGIDEIDIAFEALKTIAKETRELGSEEAGAEWLKNCPTWWVEPDEILEPIQSFFRLPYRRRVWIFQELVLGKHIPFLRGSTILTYEDLARAGSRFHFTQNFVSQWQNRKAELFEPRNLDYVDVSLPCRDNPPMEETKVEG